jgi:hypothetical protein
MRVTALLFGIAISAYGCSSSSGTRKGGTDGGGVADASLDRGGTGSGGISVQSGGGNLGNGGAGAGGVLWTGGTIATGGTRGIGGGTGAGGVIGEVGAGGSLGTGGILATGGILGTGGSSAIDGGVGIGGRGGSTGIDGGVGVGGTIGTGGSMGTGGITGTCAEPMPCEGFDNRPDANLSALISCLSPSTVPSNAMLTLSIYGHHLATGPSDNALVTVGSGSPLNGVPVTACHLNVQVPANQLSASGQVPVTVSPGGWIQDSVSVSLTIR